jgi:predicted nucleic acid-binding protein
MTALPGDEFMSPEVALLFINEIRDRCTLITLTGDEYVSTIEKTASAGFTSGRVYDALLLRCAAKVKADVIYTLNLRHFRAIDPALASRMRAP